MTSQAPSSKEAKMLCSCMAALLVVSGLYIAYAGVQFYRIGSACDTPKIPAK